MTVVRYVRKQFDIPDEGLHDGVISEFRDLGMVTGFNGQKQAKLQAIYELDELGSNGEPLKVFQRFNNTLHPQSFLYKAITDITGTSPGEAYELDDLIGRRVQLLIKHNEGANGVTYANVENILRPKTHVEEASEKRIQNAIDNIGAAQAAKPDSNDQPAPQAVAGKPKSENSEEKAKLPKSGPVRKPAPVVRRAPIPIATAAESEISDEDIPF
jgi:hypothetical protein